MTVWIPKYLRKEIEKNCEAHELNLSQFARKVFDEYCYSKNDGIYPPKEAKKR